VPCRAVLRDFRADHGQGTVITNDKLDGKPLLENESEAVSDLPVSVTENAVTCTIPPHSIVFLRLAGK
jgi:hypothetical protein